MEDKEQKLYDYEISLRYTEDVEIYDVSGWSFDLDSATYAFFDEKGVIALLVPRESLIYFKMI